MDLVGRLCYHSNCDAQCTTAALQDAALECDYDHFLLQQLMQGSFVNGARHKASNGSLWSEYSMLLILMLSHQLALPSLYWCDPEACSQC